MNTRSAARTVLAGAAIGAVYGIALRGWMRLVSTDPEFSWGGTGYVVAAFTVLGTTAGLATAARARGHGRRLLAARAAGIVLSLGCFVAAGAAMLPTILPAALGRSRTDWPGPLRVALVAIGGAVAIAISLTLTLTGIGTGRLVLALLLYLALCAVEVEITARLYAPSLPSGTVRGPLRIAAAAAAITALVAVVTALFGLPAPD